MVCDVIAYCFRLCRLIVLFCVYLVCVWYLVGVLGIVFIACTSGFGVCWLTVAFGG